MGKLNSKLYKTKNINDAINEFASTNSIQPSKCDFKIDKVETYIRDSSDSEFKLFNENIKEHYKDKEKLTNEHVEFSQSYTITVFTADEKKIKLKSKVIYDDSAINPAIIISEKSIIPHKRYKQNELFKLIKKEVNKIKAKENILINIFDEMMIKDLTSLVKYIYAGKFLKAVKIPLFDGITPKVTQESKLVIKFLQNNLNNQVIEVEKNEVLVEYYKPKFGRNGLDCHGKIIGVTYGNNVGDLTQKVDFNTIKIEENERKKQYISRVKGFVQYNETTLSIDNKIKMHTLSRVENTIASEEKNNIEVIISQNDSTIDSVGEGVELVSERIDINGHVGAKSIIEAQYLNIAGATHQDSTQYAKYANINRHKGTLRCHKAKIKLLEGGEVHATSVNIETSLGGSIYAQDVYITHVKSNLKIFASNSITIKVISGEDNKLKINYKDIPILISKIELINDDIEDLNFSLEEAQRHNSSMTNEIKNQIKSLKEEILKIKDSSKRATISIKEPLRGLNEITFRIDNKNELTFKTEALQYQPFYLEIDGDKITLHPTTKTITLES